MGIQLNGTSGTDTISAIDGTLTVDGVITATDKLSVGAAVTSNVSGINVTGIVTATSFSGSGANLTGITGTTINNNANNRVITGSGTANTLEGESTLTYDGTFLTATSNNFVLKGIDTNASNAESFIQLNAGKIFYHSDENNAASGSGHYFHVDGSEKVRIDAGGKLLLGTTTAGQTGEADALTVYQAGHTGITIRTGGTSNNTAIYFADGTSGDQNYRGSITYTHSGDNLVFKTAAAERLRILSDGRVLIGTTTGAAFSSRRFTVSDTTSGGTTAIEIRSATNGTGRLYFTDSTNSSDAGSYAGKVLYDHTDDHMGFWTNGNAERVRVESNGDLKVNDGNLIIGTAGHGIDFSATNPGNSQTSHAELLDDYEEGVFTVTCDNSVTLSQNEMRYTKIGNLVNVSGMITVNNDNSQSTFRPNNFPFNNVGSGFKDLSTFSMQTENWDLHADHKGFGGYVENAKLYIRETKDNASPGGIAADSGASMLINVTYRTND